MLAMVAPLAAPGAEPALKKGSVVVIPIQGEVSEAQFYFLRRVLKQAEASEAAAFIIDMDTYGGGLKAAVNMQEALMKSKVPTITYVNPNAGSAGALIALSTKRIYMAPVSAIGAAAPVMSGGQSMEETMNAKVVSYFSGYFRSAAETNGYNPELAEAFINKDKEVKVDDVVINKAGSLLTLSAQEAVKEYGGKPLLAQAIAGSVEELCRKAELDPAAVVRVEPSGFETIAQWITALAPLFMLGGIVGAYLEFKTPGFGIAGMLSLICFLLFFAGHYVAGLTGYEVVAVFVLGLVMIVLELVFFPGITVLAAVGTAMVLGSLLFAMVDFYPSQPLEFSFDLLVRPLANLTVAIAFSVVGIALIARFFPHIPIFRRVILASSSPSGPAFTAETARPLASGVRAGDEGVSRSILRPAGKAEIGGELVDVVTEGEFVEAGKALRVLRVEGERVIVTEAISH